MRRKPWRGDSLCFFWREMDEVGAWEGDETGYREDMEMNRIEDESGVGG